MCVVHGVKLVKLDYSGLMNFKTVSHFGWWLITCIGQFKNCQLVLPLSPSIIYINQVSVELEIKFLSSSISF